MKDYPRRARFVGAFMALSIALSASQIVAQEASTEGETEPPQMESAPVVPKPALKSPRATLQTFLQAMKRGDMDRTISCLDLSYLTSNVGNVSGPNIAHQLKSAMDHLVGITTESPGWIWNSVPDENDYAQEFTLDLIPGSREDADKLVLTRGEDANWRFSRETCQAAEVIFAEIEQLPAMVDEEQAEGTVPFPIHAAQLPNSFAFKACL